MTPLIATAHAADPQHDSHLELHYRGFVAGAAVGEATIEITLTDTTLRNMRTRGKRLRDPLQGS